MLNRVTICRLALVPLALLFGLAIASWQGQGQAQQREQERTKETIEVTLPPDRDLLRLRVVTPSEVRVNESFEGQIEVANLSDKIAFHDIKIGQLADSQLAIESSHVGQSKGGSAQAGADKQSAKQDQKSQDQKKQGQKKQNQRKAQQQSNQQQGQQQGNEKFAQIWTIERLDPGETQTIHITASSSEQGDVKSCLALVSMTPSLCLSTRFVKPELEIVKQGPDQVNLCEPIVYTYAVKNSGTGEIESFVIHDKLAEGLKTLEGESELRFEVDGLRAGDVRKFSAKLVPTKSGEFKSRATADSKAAGQARSNSVTTRVVEPRLALAIDGPDAVYVDRLATYTVRVTNHGQGRADATAVVLRFPESLSVAAVTEPWDTERNVEQQNRSQDQGQQPKEAGKTDDQAANAKSGQKKKAGEDSASKKSRDKADDEAAWDLGDLAPGETKAVRVTLNTHRGDTVRLEAEAVAWCGRGDEALRVAKVTELQRTEIISLPALALAVVDLEDPVQTGDKVAYRVVVRNEGTSADSDVRIRIELPQQLKFVEASGATDAKADGNQITFEPVKQLGAGEEVSWRIEAKATGEGEVALRATLESKGLGKAARAEEPTTLFTASARQESAKQ